MVKLRRWQLRAPMHACNLADHVPAKVAFQRFRSVLAAVDAEVNAIASTRRVPHPTAHRSRSTHRKAEPRGGDAEQSGSQQSTRDLLEHHEGRTSNNYRGLAKERFDDGAVARTADVQGALSLPSEPSH